MILVFGATGRVGGEVARSLAATGEAVRCLVRDASRASALVDAGIDVVGGDLDDTRAIAAALAGVKRVFLMSPVGETMTPRQCAVIDAAVAAGVDRIVKLSGSSWTIEAARETATGAAHAVIEERLIESGIAHVNLRPNAFMQGMLARLPGEIAQGDSFGLALGEAAVSFIDVRDIADVAVTALCAPSPGSAARHLTGPRAWSGAEIAALASELCGRTINYRAIAPAAALALARTRGESAFMQKHLEQVMERIGAGVAAEVTGEVEAACGRPARALEDWLRESRSPAMASGA